MGTYVYIQSLTLLKKLVFIAHILMLSISNTLFLFFFHEVEQCLNIHIYTPQILIYYFMISFPSTSTTINIEQSAVLIFTNIMLL